MCQEMSNNSRSKRAILSICIPIYNRLPYLQKMLERFIEDKSLFDSQIELIISDNCSKDDLKSVVDDFSNRGLRLNYYRQQENGGPDNNFLFCFGKATGKYCWLLGSDDIPVRGFLKFLISKLDNNDDYGLVFLRQGKPNKWYRIVKTDVISTEVIEDNQKMLCDVNIYITFMSSNIFRTEFVRQIDLKKYMGTNLIQVPLYIKSCLSSDRNLMINYNHSFEPDNDDASSGGYNFYGVFVNNMFSILREFVDEGLFSPQSYEKFKRNEFDYYLLSSIKSIFVDRVDKIHKVDNAFNIMWNHYGRHYYTYYDFVKYVCVRSVAKILGK